MSHQRGPAREGKIFNEIEHTLAEDGMQVEETSSDEHYSIVCLWHGYGYNLVKSICKSDRTLRLLKYEVVEHDEFLFIDARWLAQPQSVPRSKHISVQSPRRERLSPK